jgi:hypothetical protein
MAEMNPDESAFGNPAEDDIIALFSELRIPAQLVLFYFILVYFLL